MAIDKKTIRLLILEDSQNEAERLVSLFRNAGRATRVHRLTSSDDLAEALQQSWDLLICAPSSEQLPPGEAIGAIRRQAKDIPVIQLLADNDSDSVTEAQRASLDILQNRFDLQTVCGRCSYPDVLRDAGAESADILLAVTDSDESNMVACQVAYSLFQIPTKIARIRSQHYFIRKELFGKENLPIDVFINPEGLVTDLLSELIQHPGALQVLRFAKGLVKLVAI